MVIWLPSVVRRVLERHRRGKKREMWECPECRQWIEREHFASEGKSHWRCSNCGYTELER
ncbi:MAG: hypothetical protein RMK49_03820 [Abditibacteriales bacterium]|nr:hypothetical protein [Abditibacteriales bacterium]